MAITILELAKHRGAREDEAGNMPCSHIEDVGLPFIGGCQVCGAFIAAYNASPSKSGYLKCAEGCIGDDGWETVEEANREIFSEDYDSSEAQVEDVG